MWSATLWARMSWQFPSMVKKLVAGIMPSTICDLSDTIGSQEVGSSGLAPTTTAARFSRFRLCARVGDIPGSPGGETRTYNQQRHATRTCKRLLFSARNLSQSIQRGFFSRLSGGRHRSSSSTRRAVLFELRTLH